MKFLGHEGMNTEFSQLDLCVCDRRVYSNIDLDNLTPASTEDTESENSDGANSAEPEILCDRCQGDTPATAYCVDCGVKSCAKHFEVRYACNLFALLPY